MLATLLQPTGQVQFDARGYWGAAGSLLGSPDPVPAGFWELRGVLSAVVYLPAQTLARATGPAGVGFAILLQNALLIGVIAAVVAPALMRPWGPPGPAARWAAATGVVIAARGFAPYALVDLYAAAGLLTALTLLTKRNTTALLLSGASLGAAFNIRPAYLVPVLLIGIVAVVYHRARAAFVALGALAALVPQMLLVALTQHALSLTPAGGDDLVRLQANYAAFTVRYDTAIMSQQPQQFFCSPAMAAAIDSPPSSLVELVGDFLRHLPQSGVFAVEKLGAALHWPLSIPYLVPDPRVDAVFALTITGISVVGCAALIAMRTSRGAEVSRAAVTVAAIGTAGTLMSAATEARFALSLVLLGAVGVGAVIQRLPRREGGNRGRCRIVAAATLTATILLLTAGWSGLSHPAPPGPVSLEMCAQVGR